jgi:hypothetical protein
MHLYWACAPAENPVKPNTASPTLNRRTRLPTCSTTPASSMPGIRYFLLGLLNPSTRRLMSVSPRRIRQSAAVTVVARTPMSTSSSPGSGFSTSSSCSTSGGPYAVQAMAFILPLPDPPGS